MAILKIIEKIEDYARVFYFPKDSVGFCDIDDCRLLITDKFNKEDPFIFYFCDTIEPTDEKFDRLILEIMDKSVDSEIILEIYHCPQPGYYEPGTEIDYSRDYLVRSIICSSKNNFHIYIPEHSIKLK